jgi:acetylornithine/succinyldiaminopimelate/putrescine aminotransferase
VQGVRGRGLLLAAVLRHESAPKVVQRALDEGLVVNAVRPDAIRFAPPLSIAADEIKEALTRFARALKG